MVLDGQRDAAQQNWTICRHGLQKGQVKVIQSPSVSPEVVSLENNNILPQWGEFKNRPNAGKDGFLLSWGIQVDFGSAAHRNRHGIRQSGNGTCAVGKRSFRGQLPT